MLTMEERLKVIRGLQELGGFSSNNEKALAMISSLTDEDYAILAQVYSDMLLAPTPGK